jgi:hypothetical protein
MKVLAVVVGLFGFWLFMHAFGTVAFAWHVVHGAALGGRLTAGLVDFGIAALCFWGAERLWKRGATPSPN